MTNDSDNPSDPSTGGGQNNGETQGYEPVNVGDMFARPGLSEILNEHETTDEKTNLGIIRFRSHPPGLRIALTRLATSRVKPVSVVTRLASMHGVTLLRDYPQIMELWSIYLPIGQRLLDYGHQKADHALGTPVCFEFLGAGSENNSFSGFLWVIADINEMTFWLGGAQDG